MIIYLQSLNIKFLGNRFREANVYLILVFLKRAVKYPNNRILNTKQHFSHFEYHYLSLD